MTIRQIVNDRDIREVLHFTTDRGLAGILASACVKARADLPSDKYVEHIYKPTCASRVRDADWHGFVNLSITRINTRLFGIAANKWHIDIQGWWCILAFAPSILSHDGVYFTTTNNMYSGVNRAMGSVGLEAIFADEVLQYAGRVVRRSRHAPSNQPTCFQAEVLYPCELSTEYLQTVYVRDEEHIDAIHGICGAIAISPPRCICDPSRFRD